MQYFSVCVCGGGGGGSRNQDVCGLKPGIGMNAKYFEGQKLSFNFLLLSKYKK